MRSLGYIPLDRASPRQALQSIQLASKQLNRGYSLIIFPEGTRSTDGKLQEFKSGSIRLAFQSSTPVVPVSIAGSGKIQPKGTMKVKGQKVALIIGKPLIPQGTTKAERAKFLEHIRKVIIKNLQVASQAVASSQR